MKHAVLVLILGALVLGCAQQRVAPPPFDLPSGVIYETDDRIEFHAFRWGTDDATALFIMSPHPAGLNRAMVDKMAESARPELVAAMRNVEGVAEVETTKGEISAGDFTGRTIFCKLKMDDGKTVYQTMHILWDGSRLWHGQLTGTTEDDLRMVEAILKSMKQDLRTKP